MKTKLRYSYLTLILLTLVLLNIEVSITSAQGTAFTYQGRLNDGGNPANGLYDFRFKLASDDLGNNYVGDAYLTNAIPVTNGQFITTVDFGAGIFTGSNYWLEVDVRTNNPANTLAYTTLAPLQGVTPAPYAIFANTASNVTGTVSATQLAGPIPAGQLSGAYPGAVTFDNSGNNFVGQFNGNGAGLTNLNAWGLTGNKGTTPGVNFAGTTDSNSFEIHVFGTRVLRLEPDPLGLGAGNVVGGYLNNSILQPGSDGDVIAGGGTAGAGNIINTNSTGVFIGSGVDNQTGPNVSYSVIGGGTYNRIMSSSSIIGAGYDNVIQSNANWSTIVGGYANNIQPYAVINTIGGGFENNIQGDSNYWAESIVTGETIAGGTLNTIQTDSTYSTIAGGYYNTLETNNYGSFIGGGEVNDLGTNSGDSTIAGGDYNDIQANSGSSSIVGGYDNVIQTNAQYSFIGGGLDNTIYGDIYNYGTSVIVGGDRDTIYPGSFNSTIGGGQNNNIGTNSDHAAVGGGYNNTIGNNDYEGTIPGGYYDTLLNNAAYAAIGGGQFNTNNSNGGTIAGGQNNFAGGQYQSSIGGGYGNSTSGSYATVPGGFLNQAWGLDSFAAGNQAIAENQGVYVWADSLNYTFDPYSLPGPQGYANSFNVRSTGGFYIVTGVNSSGNITSGAYLNAGATSWSTLSDRNAKKDFTPVDYQSVLDKLASVPIESWHYKWESDSDVPNIGPMAQDFKHAFYPGRDDKSITTLEFDGVELAAIQGLNQKLNEKDARIQEQGAEIETLKQNLADLQKLVQTLAAQK